jgi:hypothetical protein
MTISDTMIWTSNLGKEYEYFIYRYGHFFDKIPGNYVFARINKSGTWRPLYIGHTFDLFDTLNENLMDHPNILQISNEGATHIHVHINESLRDREEEAADLINMWQPVCND